MMESAQSDIVIEDVSYDAFLSLLTYLYTDHVTITVDNAMILFQVADRFGVDRLKYLCEHHLLCAMTVENAASLLHVADRFNAAYLREKVMVFILTHFDMVSKTTAFEEQQ